MNQTKCLVLLIVLFCSDCLKTEAQIVTPERSLVQQFASIIDSLTYVNEIVANKAKYIDQPFSVLLTDLKIFIKSYYPRGRAWTSSVFISFDDSVIRKKYSCNKSDFVVGVYTEWKTPLHTTEEWTLLSKGLTTNG